VASTSAAASIPLERVRPTTGVEVYEVDPIQELRWAALVANHPHSSVFHSPKWLQALRDVYGYEPVVLTMCAPGATLTNGLVFCRIRSWLTGRRLVSLPFSDHCDPLADTPDEIDALLLQMRRNVDCEKWRYLEVRPIAYQPGSSTGMSRGMTYLFHRLDLRPPERQLFQSFHKDCVQRKIRRAERENLTYEAGTSDDLLKKFYALMVMTRRRQGLPPQPLAWFRGLIAAFGKDLKIRVASKDGVPVASILTLSHKKTVVYKYGCSDAAYNRLGGTALLFWQTIREAKNQGFDELELGRSDTDNAGLIAFKERWGASRHSISYWTYPENEPAPLDGWKKMVMRRAVSAAPPLALEAVGSLLYKHIG
jgi:CelD/BcsL family acetyltransferase involved in cellulose biosynthesis